MSNASSDMHETLAKRKNEGKRFVFGAPPAIKEGW